MSALLACVSERRVGCVQTESVSGVVVLASSKAMKSLSVNYVGSVALPVAVACCFLKRAILSYIDMYLSHNLDSFSA